MLEDELQEKLMNELQCLHCPKYNIECDGFNCEFGVCSGCEEAKTSYSLIMEVEEDD